MDNGNSSVRPRLAEIATDNEDIAVNNFSGSPRVYLGFKRGEL
jgi:hypothetical protein